MRAIHDERWRTWQLEKHAAKATPAEVGKFADLRTIMEREGFCVAGAQEALENG